MKKDTYDISDILSSLNDYDKAIVKDLHEYTVSLGFRPKISAVDKKPDDWKCEYIKNKTVLYILRVTNAEFNIKCKFINVTQYNDILESCTKDCIKKLLKNSGDCKNHGGGCKGPIAFSIDGKNYTKCRHAFMFKELKKGEINGIKKLIECEDKYIK
jgi:hypothetical protein